MVFININELEEKQIYPGYKARLIHTGNMTIIHWLIEEGSYFPEHLHSNEQVLNILEGSLELTVGIETKILKSGDVAIIPPNVHHSGKALKKTKAIDVFYPHREDYM